MSDRYPCQKCGAPTKGGRYLNEALLEQTKELVQLRQQRDAAIKDYNDELAKNK